MEQMALSPATTLRSPVPGFTVSTRGLRAISEPLFSRAAGGVKARGLGARIGQR